MSRSGLATILVSMDAEMISTRDGLSGTGFSTCAAQVARAALWPSILGTLLIGGAWLLQGYKRVPRQGEEQVMHPNSFSRVGPSCG